MRSNPLPVARGSAGAVLPLSSRAAIAAGACVNVSQGTARAVLAARQDATLAPNVVRVPAGHPDTASLGAMFGAITVEKA